MEYVRPDIPPTVVLPVDARQLLYSVRVGGAWMMLAMSDATGSLLRVSRSSLGLGELSASQMMLRYLSGTWVGLCSERK